MPPNVIVICCDDLGYGDLGCYGATYETPAIDRLAETGVRFTHWLASAPICAPSRAAMLTGRYPHDVGVPTNVPSVPPQQAEPSGLSPDATTLSGHLSEAGYATACFGKWHLGTTPGRGPNAHGFDSFVGFLSGCIDYYSHLFVWGQDHGVEPYHDLWEDTTEIHRNGEYVTDLITGRATDWIERHRDEPFFLYLPYNAPHYPMHAPAEYFRRHDDLESERRATAAMVSTVDDAVGAVAETLRRTGQYEETMIVFTSDHGPSREVRNHLDGSGTPFRGGSTGGLRGEKFSLLDGGLRVPGIVSWPARLDAGTTDAVAAGIDLFPTVADACTDATPAGRDGVSLLPALVDGTALPERSLYWEFGGQYAVRRGGWKLVVDAVEVDGDAPVTLLADVDSDPRESTDRRDDRPETAAELATRLDEWATDRGMAVPDATASDP